MHSVCSGVWLPLLVSLESLWCVKLKEQCTLLLHDCGDHASTELQRNFRAILFSLTPYTRDRYKTEPAMHPTQGITTRLSLICTYCKYYLWPASTPNSVRSVTSPRHWWTKCLPCSTYLGGTAWQPFLVLAMLLDLTCVQIGVSCVQT